MKLGSGYLVSRPRFEQNTLRIQAYSAIAAPPCSVPEYRKQLTRQCGVILYVLVEGCQTRGLTAVCCALTNVNVTVEFGPTPCLLFPLI